MTNQGWRDHSTWSRGQAWAIMGFAQVYTWTKDTKYLHTAIKCAEYFLQRCKEGEGKWHHPLVPLWDFDAPIDDPAEPLRDVSAALATANGLLLIHQSLQSLSDPESSQLADAPTKFLDLALQIVGQTLDMSYDHDYASFERLGKSSVNGAGATDIKVSESGFDAILKNSTTNWNPDAHKKYKDHGLVYADYYLLEFGNKLLRAGLL